jgi:hypothetical protein
MLFMGMTAEKILLAAMVAMVSVFAIATLCAELLPSLRELANKTQQLTQTGDSTLGPRSMTWLAATAFAGAVFICFVLV